MGELRALKSSIRLLKQPVREILAGRRKINEKWDLIVVEVNMPGWKLDDAQKTRKRRAPGR